MVSTASIWSVEELFFLIELISSIVGGMIAEVTSFLSDFIVVLIQLLDENVTTISVNLWSMLAIKRWTTRGRAHKKNLYDLWSLKIPSSAYNPPKKKTLFNEAGGWWRTVCLLSLYIRDGNRKAFQLALWKFVLGCSELSAMRVGRDWRERMSQADGSTQGWGGQSILHLGEYICEWNIYILSYCSFRHMKELAASVLYLHYLIIHRIHKILDQRNQTF